MKEEERLLEQLKEQFDLNVSVTTGKAVLKVPPMIRIEYKTFFIQIEMQNFIAVVPKNDDVHSIKRLQILLESHDEPIIYIAPYINAPMRKQLVKEKISYVSNDMVYLFPLLCSKNKIQVPKKKKNLLPFAVQSILLYMIYNAKQREYFTFEDIKPIFHQSDTSLYRHIQTLEDLDIIERIDDNSKNKQFRLKVKNPFNQLLSIMRSPVRSVTYIDENDYNRIMAYQKHLLAGESALEEFNLSVGTKTFALYYKEIKQEQWDKSNYSTSYYEGYNELQLWHYEPKDFLASSLQQYNNQCVDPISLYLSLKKEASKDVRVGDAVDKLYNFIQGQFGW